MIIHGPDTVPYDIGEPRVLSFLQFARRSTDKVYADVGPIFLTDWFHRDYYSIVQDVVGTDISKVVSRTS
jgi:hypothetical protein